AGTGATLEVSATAWRTFSGTGWERCVSNDPRIIVIVEQAMPMTIGSNPIPSVEPVSSETTEAKVPTTIELIAPTVFAFFHHTAQIYAGTKADPRTDVAKTTTSKTPGGSVIASATAIAASRRIVMRDTFTEVRSLIVRWKNRAHRSCDAIVPAWSSNASAVDMIAPIIAAMTMPTANAGNTVEATSKMANSGFSRPGTISMPIIPTM